MTIDQNALLWTQPDWLAQAHAWIHAELDRQNLRARGAIEQPHIRPWSTVLRVPTNDGDVFFKALPPVLAREVAITHALARWRPDCMPRVLAVDATRGWMLMADGGTRLRDLLRPARDITHWHRVLPLYAALQIEMAHHVAELIALGAPDRRLAALPAEYERLLSDTEILRVDQTPGITSAEYQRLLDLTPRFTAQCRALAQYPIPESLHHGDLHDGNIFVREGRYIFFDWGDASVTHPFFSFRTVMVSNENSLGLSEDAPEHNSLRDIYLEAWMRFDSRENLLSAFNLARQLWMIPTALVWHRILANSDTAVKAQYAEPVPALLQEFLNAQSDQPHEKVF